MTDITEAMQQSEPGPLLEFFELDATRIGGDVLRFHAYNDGPITWQGQLYSPWPIRAEGFAKTSLQPSRPKIVVSNINGSISYLCYVLQDFVGAVLTRHRTFAQYLDGQPGADPSQEFPPEIWFVERKDEETREQIAFELSSAMEFDGVMLPRRQIIANFCQWVATGGYRGPYCGYTGPPVAKADDSPTSDPLLDRCGGRLTSCKLRFGQFGKLPFGGAPAAGLVRI